MSKNDFGGPNERGHNPESTFTVGGSGNNYWSGLVYYKDMSRKIPIPREKLEQLLTVRSLSLKQIAQTLGCSKSVVYRRRKKYGITSRKRRVSQGNGNIKAFQNVSNPEIAYILGLIWADGWVSDLYGKVTINMVESDAKHLLVTLRRHCKPSVSYVEAKSQNGRNNKPQLAITISDVELVEYLSSLNCHKKSWEAPTQILETIPSIYRSAFWLGYHDGDGGLDTKRYRCGYSSTIEQDWTEHIKLCDTLGIAYRLRHYQHPTKPHSFSSLTVESIRRTRRLIEYVYQYAPVVGCLPRKLATYHAFMTIPLPRIYVPPTDPIIIQRRARQNELRRKRRLASHQKVDILPPLKAK